MIRPGLLLQPHFPQSAAVVLAAPPRQGQFQAFIYYYTKINKRPPAEADMQRYFEISAPSVHAIVAGAFRTGDDQSDEEG